MMATLVKLRAFLFVLIFLTILTGISLFIFFSRAIKQPIKEQKSILLGAWTEGFFDPITQKLHPEKLTSFQKLINKKVSIAHYYLGWEALTTPQLLSQFSLLHRFGWQPMLSTNPYYFSDCKANPLPLYTAIANGLCDDFLKRAGTNLSKIQQPFYFVFAWEMNNENNQWSITTTGSTTTDFIHAWQHIHTIFAKQHVKNIIWVFCPNVPDNTTTPYAKIYPGNAYVDWICLDGYNWGTTQSWSSWGNFADIFTSSYNTLTHIAPSKPLMLGEFNTTDQGGNKADWYTDALTQQIPDNFPDIKAVVIFNENRPQEHVNWQIDSNPDALKAFSQSISLPIYK